MYHLHDDIDSGDQSMRKFLKREWVTKYFSFQPMDEIAAYFGEKVALYFVYMGFYNMWLALASVFGILTFLYGIGEAAT